MDLATNTTKESEDDISSEKIKDKG